MSNLIRAIVKAHNSDIARENKITLRNHLNADALFTSMKTEFDNIKDHRPGNVQHSLGDILMAGFAMFSLKDPSLLAFDERRLGSSGDTILITRPDSCRSREFGSKEGDYIQRI